MRVDRKLATFPSHNSCQITPLNAIHVLEKSVKKWVLAISWENCVMHHCYLTFCTSLSLLSGISTEVAEASSASKDWHDELILAVAGAVISLNADCKSNAMPLFLVSGILSCFWLEEDTIAFSCANNGSASMLKMFRCVKMHAFFFAEKSVIEKMDKIALFRFP